MSDRISKLLRAWLICPALLTEDECEEAAKEMVGLSPGQVAEVVATLDAVEMSFPFREALAECCLDVNG